MDDARDGDEQPAEPVGARDSRLEIPEVLRKPVPRPEYDPAAGKLERSHEPSDMVGMGKAWAIALDFVFTIIAGALIGWAVDYWRHSLPLWTLIGLGAGFVTAFIRIVRRALREDKAEQARRTGRR